MIKKFVPANPKEIIVEIITLIGKEEKATPFNF